MNNATAYLIDMNKIDELNIIEYEDYFGEMEISDQEKKDRINLAKKFERAFERLFEMIKDSTKEECYEYIDNAYCEIATDYMGKKITPAYIVSYAAYITMEIIDTTLENAQYEYYTSIARLLNISANEANTIGNYRLQTKMISKGYKFKTWKTMKDKYVRHTHVEVDDKKINIFEPFKVGNSELMFPKDMSLGASANEIVNCRCSIIYTKN